MVKRRGRIQPPPSAPPRIYVPHSYLVNPDTGEIIETNLFDEHLRANPMQNPDDIERTWFRFSLPLMKRNDGARDAVIFIEAFVPAETEEEAREVLAKNCYDGAPVASWPILGTVRRTRSSFIPGA